MEDKDEWVYIKINKGMYGLPQDGILAINLLIKRLAEKRYYQSQYTPGLWKHLHSNIAFFLVVDNFGIKTTKMEHMLHLCVCVDSVSGGLRSFAVGLAQRFLALCPPP